MPGLTDALSAADDPEAVQLGRQWIGIDIDPKAYTVVTERLKSLLEVAARPEPERRRPATRIDVPRIADAKLRD